MHFDSVLLKISVNKDFAVETAVNCLVLHGVIFFNFEILGYNSSMYVAKAVCAMMM